MICRFAWLGEAAALVHRWWVMGGEQWDRRGQHWTPGIPGWASVCMAWQGWRLPLTSQAITPQLSANNFHWRQHFATHFRLLTHCYHHPAPPQPCQPCQPWYLWLQSSGSAGRHIIRTPWQTKLREMRRRFAEKQGSKNTRKCSSDQRNRRHETRNIFL